MCDRMINKDMKVPEIQLCRYCAPHNCCCCCCC